MKKQGNMAQSKEKINFQKPTLKKINLQTIRQIIQKNCPKEAQ